MKDNDEISKDDCTKLATKICDDIYKPAYNFKTTIFLCGAGKSQKDKMRFKIENALKNSWQYLFRYDFIYAEDIFDELLYSSKTKDLLSLEGLLAESVDAIVLIPESPGSFAELGAFANDEKLRKKLICIIDNKYKKDKSFINQGPLKLVKEANSMGLIFVDSNDIGNVIDKLTTSLNIMKRISTKKGDKISLLQLDNFLLPSIFLLEPVAKETLLNMVASATQDEGNAFQTTTAALTSLTKKRLVESTISGYKLTTLGVKNFLKFRRTSSRIKKQTETIEVDNLRLEILNLKNRKRRLAL